MSETQERVYLEHGAVKVTNARFMVPSQTYAMSGITSVRFFTEKPNWLWPGLFFVIAVVMLTNNGNIWSIVIPLAVGMLLLLRKPTYHVVLSSASGETRALNNKNKQLIEGVISALNQAIISRG